MALLAPDRPTISMAVIAATDPTTPSRSPFSTLRAPSSDAPTQTNQIPWYGPTYTHLLVTLCGALVVTLALVAVYGKLQLDRRDATITELERIVAEVTTANTAFQKELHELSDERQVLLTERENLRTDRASLTFQRDQLTAQRDQLTSQRDQFAAQRDQFITERDKLKGEVAELQKRASDLDASLGESNRQLNQARQEGARQQSRAISAENMNTVLAAVVQLDEAIQKEFLNFLRYYEDFNRSVNRRDFYGADIAYRQGMQSSARLEDLFRLRNEAWARLR